MFPHRPYAVGLVRRALLCLFLMSGGGVRAQEAQPGNGTAANLREIKDGEFAASIERALRGAQRRLRRPECARLFDDFSDGTGRLLSEVLATLAMTPTEPPARALFRDGRENERCRTSPVAAFTGPGSRVVFVCGNRFRAIGDESSTTIRTVHGHGYAFAADAREAAANPEASGDRHVLAWLLGGLHSVPLRQGVATIGRDPTTTVPLQTPKASWHHARLEVSADHVRLEDLGSKNGTLVRGERITGPIDLQDGDDIIIGATRLVFRRGEKLVATATDEPL